ncbi:MAG: hypothetical protein ACXWVS_10615, partial [Hyphomicrobium sp.]
MSWLVQLNSMISVTGPPARMEIVSIRRLSGNCGDIAKDMEALRLERTDYPLRSLILQRNKLKISRASQQGSFMRCSKDNT